MDFLNTDEEQNYICHFIPSPTLLLFTSLFFFISTITYVHFIITSLPLHQINNSTNRIRKKITVFLKSIDKDCKQ